MFMYTLFAGFLIGFSVGIGAFGYHLVADLEWIDSFHMACLILTGMGPVLEMKKTTSKLFYIGVAFLSITAVFFAPLIHRVLHILHLEDQSES